MEKYIIICEDGNGDQYVQVLINDKTEWIPFIELENNIPVLYGFKEASKICKESNVGIYALINGRHYFIKEYEEL